MDFTEIQELVFKEYVKNGYYKSWDTAEKLLLKHLGGSAISDLAELGLIDTEVSEAMEKIRKVEEVDIGGELADIVIRVMNFATRKGVNLEEVILEKHDINMEREYMHGTKA